MTNRALILQGLRTAAADSREAAEDFRRTGFPGAAVGAEAFGAEAERQLEEAELPTHEEVLIEITRCEAALAAETDAIRLEYLTTDLGFFVDLLEEVRRA